MDWMNKDSGAKKTWLGLLNYYFFLPLIHSFAQLLQLQQVILSQSVLVRAGEGTFNQVIPSIEINPSLT